MSLTPLLANDVVEVASLGHNLVTGGAVVNRQFYLVASTPGTPVSTVADAATSLRAVWVANVLQSLSVNYRLDKTVAKRVAGVSALGGSPRRAKLIYGDEASNVITADGADAGAGLPAFLTASCKYVLDRYGKYWRGGIRLGPLAETALSATLEDALHGTFLANCTINVNLWNVSTVIAGGSTLRPVHLSPIYWAYVIAPTDPPVDATANISRVDVNPYVKTELSRAMPHVP